MITHGKHLDYADFALILSTLAYQQLKRNWVYAVYIGCTQCILGEIGCTHNRQADRLSIDLKATLMKGA